MATFRFENGAVSALTQDLVAAATEMFLPAEDVPLFPTLGAGEAFPITIADADGTFEILYVTALASSGKATVERAREGTNAFSWLAGTTIQHTLTRDTLFAIGGLKPKGAWSNATAYTTGDLVEHEGLSYIAVTGGANHEPPNPTYWQAIFNPAESGGAPLSQAGVWSAATPYTANTIVSWEGYLWLALANNLNSEPGRANSDWRVFALSGAQVYGGDAALATGTNNYAVTTSPALAALFNGATIRLQFQNANTASSTLSIDGLTAKPLRPKIGANFSAGALDPNSIYEFVYLEAVDSLILVGQDTSGFMPKTGGTFSGALTVTARTTANEFFTAGSYGLRETGGVIDRMLDWDSAGAGFYLLPGAELKINGQVAWTAGNFDPATKASLAGATFTGDVTVPKVILNGVQDYVLDPYSDGRFRVWNNGAVVYSIGPSGDLETLLMGNVKTYIDTKETTTRAYADSQASGAIGLATTNAQNLINAQAVKGLRRVDVGLVGSPAVGSSGSASAPAGSYITGINTNAGVLFVYAAQLQYFVENTGWVATAG